MSYMNHFISAKDHLPAPTPTSTSVDDHIDGMVVAVNYASIVKESSAVDTAKGHSKHTSASRDELKRPKRAKRTSLPTKLTSKLKSELLRAAADGNIQPFVKLTALLSRPAGLAFTDDFGWTALMIAAGDGHIKLLEYLVKTFSASCLATKCKDKAGLDAVAIAERAGHVDAAAYLQSLLSQQQPILIEQQRNDEAAMAESTSSDASPAAKPQPWYCPICQDAVGEDRRTHTSSIVHNVKCQHDITAHPYHLQASNRGYQMMKRAGWDEVSGLGPAAQGRIAPVKTVLKRSRHGLGTVNAKGETVNKARVTHFKANDVKAVVGPPRAIPQVGLSKKKAAKMAQAEREHEKALRLLLK
eukprot:TRINITY_DN4230_c0_g1_i1.p1 TRINITY_DN4230_c0_g1~~TRINITY_DN4230_c0_g1_i1.p1  ORF type:complete len:357 (+),score=71.25 TRINITY_DN4230_c0_g1_i1:203-1273(+)